MQYKNIPCFDAKVKYEKRLETETDKVVSEAFVVDAISYTEAEARITEEVAKYTTSEITVQGLKKGKYSGVLFSEKGEDDKWYKIKAQITDIDGKTTNECYLVQAKTLLWAVQYLQEYLNGQDFEVSSAVDSKVMDVLCFDKQAE